MSIDTETTSDSPPKEKRPRRWIIPLALVLVWVFVAGPLGSFAGQLAQVQENDNAGFLPESAESTQVLELQEGFSGQEDIAPAIVVYEFEQPIGPAELEQVAADIAGEDAAIGGERQRHGQRAVAGEDADLDRPSRADQLDQ